MEYAISLIRFGREMGLETDGGRDVRRVGVRSGG